MMASACCQNPVTLNALLSGMDLLETVPKVEVTGLNLDSRRIEPGDVFVALSGADQHGMSFARRALDRGAVAILFDPKKEGGRLADELGTGIEIIIPVDELDQKLSFIAGRFFENPSSKLIVIGVTGTDGKTSCSHFLSQSVGASLKTAVIGTLGWGTPEKLNPSQHTTPDAIELQKNLASLLQSRVEFVAMEVSSHSQVQGRANGVQFDGAVFTNIRRDHLDYHETVEAYRNAKLRILKSKWLQFVVFNLDDQSAGYILKEAPSSLKRFGFSRNPDYARSQPKNISIVYAYQVNHHQNGLSFHVQFNEFIEELNVPIFGDFHVDNLLAAIACLIAMGNSLAYAARMIGNVKGVPGRLERIFLSRLDPVVMIDYAHTPNALERALESVRLHCRERIILVFGCGGNRDRGKRSQMGMISERLADAIIITDDNPRHEDSEAIIGDILQGCESDDVTVIQNRKAAIQQAIESASMGDLVLIAGKGHETTQEISGIKYPLSDCEVAREALMNRARGRSD